VRVGSGRGLGKEGCPSPEHSFEYIPPILPCIYVCIPRRTLRDHKFWAGVEIHLDGGDALRAVHRLSMITTAVKKPRLSPVQSRFEQLYGQSNQLHGQSLDDEASSPGLSAT
jgi:hypothetical protein